jgi:GT2 family glycosyltransferase
MKWNGRAAPGFEGRPSQGPMTASTCSVIIPSLRRPDALRRCLRGLAGQTRVPDEVLVVWQAEDVPTRDAADALRPALPFPLRAVHCREAGIVPAENRGLDVATGQVVLLTDDDAVVPPDWVARHMAHYRDPTVGAVGGPVDNILPDGSPLPRRAVEPAGRVTWYGRVHGNLHDHVPGWRRRPPREVDHLAGANLSLRRCAFGRFEAGLRPYWQLFELDACLQAKARGYRVLFDFANAVEHFPEAVTPYSYGRDGDLGVKVLNAAYNRAFVLAKHSPWHLRPWRLLYLLSVGTGNTPGPLAFPLTVIRYGRPRREASLVRGVWHGCLAGWETGTSARRAVGPGPGRAADPIPDEDRDRLMPSCNGHPVGP